MTWKIGFWLPHHLHFTDIVSNGVLLIVCIVHVLPHGLASTIKKLKRWDCQIPNFSGHLGIFVR
ncbi:MAG: hypothetical protein WA678_03885 [Rhabdochlamydiaceae bacterium]